MTSEEQQPASRHELHQRYEPEKPVHRAVNITLRALQDRVETVKHEEYDLWKGHDEVLGITSDRWWCEPETAVELFAHRLSNRICHVNDCMTYLGDTEALHCDECHPDEYIECAHPECDYPTNHSETDHCWSHTRNHGRAAKVDYDVGA